MSKKLDGKVAIVTGASKGIGASIAEHLGKEGAKVVVNYAKSREGADKVVAKIVKNGSQALAIQADMTKPAEIEKLFSETLKAFGKLDVLINNAGVYEFATLEEITPTHFHKMFDLNVLGLILASREAVSHFGDKGGNIINISSIASTIARANASVYSATKAAVDAITKSLSKELGPRNIRVNSVNPGLVETEGTQTMGMLDSDFRTSVEKESPLRRIGKPQDIAPAVVFLASDDSSWITGETLLIAGGVR
ncbi:SDR family NAD(P)-dependent oxidoreductase [Criblamydia sequanensis]|uniref:Short-chain dehydrogenase/reductase n=1 Tax=Candidatus Criblamydia sequanensis CRIB-18 TaxID=1437425 RepID=A0A090D2Y1_9BACT|nr:glucose 1-dehydrogenase [Criblamydia sequanensis]CDR34733.1 Short-chain dehydrogenase/reductase [Criblamydia sequanensis CRIB-18]